VEKRKIILDLTSNPPLRKLLDLGLVEPRPQIKQMIKNLLKFDSKPTEEEIQKRAKKLVDICENDYLKDLEERGIITIYDDGETNYEVPIQVLINVPIFLAILVNELDKMGFVPVCEYGEDLIQIPI